MKPELLTALERILQPFMDEALPEGGIDIPKSTWQKPGRGSGVGSAILPGRADVRYLPFLVIGLYRMAELTGNRQYLSVANAQVSFMACKVIEPTSTWALGNALA